MDEKQCVTCERVKPTSAFHTRRRSRVRGGQMYVYVHISTECKDCEHGKRDQFKRSQGDPTANKIRTARGDAKRRTGGVLSTLTTEEWEALLVLYRRTCAYCRRPLRLDVPPAHDAYLTLDHVRPLDRGGTHTKENVVPCCRWCNERKGRRLIRPLPPPTYSGIQTRATKA